MNNQFFSEIEQKKIVNCHAYRDNEWLMWNKGDLSRDTLEFFFFKLSNTPEVLFCDRNMENKPSKLLTSITIKLCILIKQKTKITIPFCKTQNSLLYITIKHNFYKM